ncbi:hypothetical protein LPJ64_003785 [Coemansia asiatica]|uniref:Uncharacterized protein n=1 Tax=Coemansia asiatica TaxID=1052880 RepID=A0A9W7XJH6_9FUNG|nr:hypothetical protein LPJ64_003785 [Coemansia asiatica]KAJ2858200.1 hypothetical protein FB639_005941 [Coemansia asiatica]
MPSAEEQKARVAEWEEKLVGKYLDDDLTDKKQNDLDQASVQPSDATEKEKDNNGDNEAQDIDEQKGMPQQQPELVKLSTLPQPVRVIKPGSRVTRDLRPNRMNVVCDEKGLILKIGFY